MTPRLPSAVILAYHRVASPRSDRHQLSVAPNVFDEALTYLHSSCSVVSLSELTRLSDWRRLPPRPVALTFDDGYEDVLSAAVPRLDAKQMPATFFLTTGGLEDEDSPDFRYWWDVLEHVFLAGDHIPVELNVRLPTGNRRFATDSPDGRRATHDALVGSLRSMPLANRRDVIEEILLWSGAHPRDIDARPLTRLEVRQLAASTNHEIGAHTVNHLWLPRQPKEVQRRELSDCKRDLEGLTGRSVTAVAYPFGAVDDQTENLTCGAGFTLGLTMQQGSVSAESRPVALSRIDAGRFESAAALAARLNSLFNN